MTRLSLTFTQLVSTSHPRSSFSALDNIDRPNNMSTTLISLSNVTAFHLLGTETIPLTPKSPQTLSIVASSPDSTSPSLTLTIGPSLAWPLVKGVTTMGSQVGNPRGYFLKPEQPKGVEAGVSGWIKIELSEGVIESGDRDSFEKVLVSHGFLLGEVVESRADDAASGKQSNPQVVVVLAVQLV
jgi:hypothetical protein